MSIVPNPYSPSKSCRPRREHTENYWPVPDETRVPTHSIHCHLFPAPSHWRRSKFSPAARSPTYTGQHSTSTCSTHWVRRLFRLPNHQLACMTDRSHFSTPYKNHFHPPASPDSAQRDHRLLPLARSEEHTSELQSRLH